MITRRQFIGTAAAASTVSTGLASGFVGVRTAAVSSVTAPPQVDLALFDARFGAGVIFGRAMSRHGVLVTPFSGDITSIWYHRLDPIWRQRPLVVAGLTTEPVLFCLEQLAWDHGLRVAYRGQHESCAQGGLRHILESPCTRPQDVAPGLSGLTPWPAQVADRIVAIDHPQPAFPSDPSARSRAESTSRSRATVPQTRLVSWLIAPKRRAPLSARAADSTSPTASNPCVRPQA